MTGSDIFEDVAALVHPLADGVAVDGDSGAAEDVHAERTRLADALRRQWEQHESDPVFTELARLAAVRTAADEASRLIVAYAREFNRDRAYTQARLAAAAGLRTHSSVRSYYGEQEVATVAAATGAKRLTTKTTQ